ncbi:sugar ABC transporter substrate-binding protein [Gracilinema caldarium]|uniref:Periplasmic sugar-binding protein n=1 Tax=Gracilinema caldarium (strain ATCC 51460 / DSM 7334 / H1) TaxID=744872 RepID=F8EWP0_GRAC1|nr:substrate-binding domain-containing protein [Gracilinema caldarium]AEJ18203.1 periplasmic sugar-binding protein [Gracilinema caldarium DSM 7334]
MKRRIFIGLLIFGLLSLIALTNSIYLMIHLDSLGSQQIDGALPKYIFAFYVPPTSSRYFQDIKKGAELAAQEHHVVLSFHSIDPKDNEIQQAVISDFNGYILCPYNEDTTLHSQVVKLQNEKRPVVIINHTIKTDKPVPFIGSNNYDVGKKMAQLIKKTEKSVHQIAIVYSQKNPWIYADRELIELGIRNELQNTEQYAITRFETRLNPLDAEALIYKIIKNYPEMNYVLFTDSNDTIAAAQALIDMNEVGRVQLIGFGNDKVIRDYIRKGVITASVVISPDKIGYQAVKSLVELVDSGFTSAAVDVGIEIVEKDSL